MCLLDSTQQTRLPRTYWNQGNGSAWGHRVTDTFLGPIGGKAGALGRLGAAAGALPPDGGRLLGEGHVHRLHGRGQVDGLQGVGGAPPTMAEGQLVVRAHLVRAAVGDVIFVPQAVALRRQGRDSSARCSGAGAGILPYDTPATRASLRIDVKQGDCS